MLAYIRQTIACSPLGTCKWSLVITRRDEQSNPLVLADDPQWRDGGEAVSRRVRSDTFRRAPEESSRGTCWRVREIANDVTRIGERHWIIPAFDETHRLDDVLFLVDVGDGRNPTSITCPSPKNGPGKNAGNLQLPHHKTRATVTFPASTSALTRAFVSTKQWRSLSMTKRAFP